MLQNKNILILSPQPWSHMHISKHHYARELAIHNTVYYVSAPGRKIGLKYQWDKLESLNLQILTYRVPVWAIFRFHFKKIYKWITEIRLLHVVKQTIDQVDICIDFGCYTELEGIQNITAAKKVFFPVDNFNFLKADMRGADFVFSVSKIIEEKFLKKEMSCFFINHGLSKEFERSALNNLNFLNWSQQEIIKIAYAGNLIIPFLDIPVFKAIINDYPSVQFHLFGGFDPHLLSPAYKEWIDFLKHSKNVFFRGTVLPAVLSEEYEKMDGFLLCYKPDYVNYYGENSHKILEYFSSGKVLISTYVSLYEGSELIAMSPKNENESLVAIFGNVLKKLEFYNSGELIKRRILFALDNTYEKQIQRIEKILYEA